MTISITRYVDIVSGAGGQAAVPGRKFGLRVATQNQLLPVGAVVKTTQLTDVESLFGTASDEYAIASKYYGFVSKQINSPRSMSFVRWNTTAVPPAIYGSPMSLPVSSFAAVTDGSIAFGTDNPNDVPVTVSGIDFSTATTFAEVAAILQTDLRLSAVPQLSAATVVYDTNRNVLIVTGTTPNVGDSLVVYPTATPATDIGQMTGLRTGLQLEQLGAEANTPLTTITGSSGMDDDFGAFSFGGAVVPTLLSDIIAIATWNHAQNVKFVYCLQVDAADAADYSAALLGLSGVAMTLKAAKDTGNDHPETIPAEILGSTNFNQPAASQNYMYYRFDNRLPAVFDDTSAELFDGLRVNYMGQTQTAGQKLSFYQTGFLTGGAQAPTDMTVYTGEMWLKDSMLVSLMNGLLELPSLPANSEGRITVLSLLQTSVDTALFNGVISPGKELTSLQIAYIKQLSGNAEAWRQVQTKGYWLDASIVSTSENGRVVYSADYILIYGKNDQIRKVTGRNVLV